MTPMGLYVTNTAQIFCRANKSFCGVQGQFLQKEPLVAEGK
jgi:hypothetical protein